MDCIVHVRQVGGRRGGCAREGWQLAVRMQEALLLWAERV